jgi:hypothetical protein
MQADKRLNDVLTRLDEKKRKNRVVTRLYDGFTS